MIPIPPWLLPYVLPLGLGAALAVSLAGNAMQWRSAAVARARAEVVRQGEIDVARELGRRQATEEFASRTAVIANMVKQDNTDLLARLDALATRAERVRVEWREKLVPAATCPPGPERMDRTNALLGTK